MDLHVLIIDFNHVIRFWMIQECSGWVGLFLYVVTWSMVIPIWFLDLSKILSWSLFAVRLSLFVVMIRVVSLRCDHTNRDYFVTKIITVFSILMTLRLKMTSSMARLRNEKCKRNKVKRYVIRKRKECNKMEFTRYQNIYWLRKRGLLL